MQVELIRYTFPDDESWPLVKESIPIGTRYELLGLDEITIFNFENNKIRENVTCYYVRREDGFEGFLPACCFRTIES